MKILVIGSKGFIGSHVAQFYTSRNSVELFECDVVTDYANDNYFLIDATNSDYNTVFRSNQFDVCINCSGAASVPDSLINPLRDFALNTYNVVKLLDTIRLEQPNCKVINLSSAAVYGNPESLPVREDMTLLPISPYGIHKMQAEQICKTYFTFYGLQTCSLRIFSAYGNGLKKQLFWDLYKKAEISDIIEIYGTGEETRDFIHIDDVVRAIDYCVNFADFQGEAINIANGEQVTICNVINIFYSFYPKKKTLHFNNISKIGDPVNWRADITFLKSMGYSSTINISQGLEKYYLWTNQLRTEIK